MVTAVQEEITYCSPGTSSGKQKNARTTNQVQLRSENTPASIEADQTFLFLEQLANNINFANINNNISRISKLPKSLTTTMPTFDGNLKSLSCLKISFKRASIFATSWMKMKKSNISIFSWRGNALQTFGNISNPTQKKLGEILAVFCI